MKLDRHARLAVSVRASSERGKPPRIHSAVCRFVPTSVRSNPAISRYSTRPARLSEAPRTSAGEALPRIRNRAGRNSMSTRFLMRMEAMRATMRMTQPFEDVWLPQSIAIRVEGTVATGAVNAAYDVEYYDYKQAEVKAVIR